MVVYTISLWLQYITGVAFLGLLILLIQEYSNGLSAKQKAYTNALSAYQQSPTDESMLAQVIHAMADLAEYTADKQSKPGNSIDEQAKADLLDALVVSSFKSGKTLPHADRLDVVKVLRERQLISQQEADTFRAKILNAL